MFLPYLNYTQPMSLCILGLENQWDDARNSDLELITLGQRALAFNPFYAVYDRENETVQVELGGAVLRTQEAANGYPKSIAIAIVVFLVIMIIYLIQLRYARLQAEDWLEKNRKILFSHAVDLKTEDEILDALVNSKEIDHVMRNRHMPSTPSKSVPAGMEKDVGQRFIDNDDDASDKGSGRSGSNKKPPSKNFIEPSQMQ